MSDTDDLNRRSIEAFALALAGANRVAEENAGWRRIHARLNEYRKAFPERWAHVVSYVEHGKDAPTEEDVRELAGPPSWERYYAVECYDCGARVGEECRRVDLLSPDGMRAGREMPHSIRIDCVDGRESRKQGP